MTNRQATSTLDIHDLSIDYWKELFQDLNILFRDLETKLMYCSVTVFI